MIASIIRIAHQAMIRRHAKIFNFERDVLGPHKQPFVYYDDYIKSPYWIARSAAKKKAAGYVCEECGAKDIELNTHHLTYERLGAELDEDLIVLCRPCHKKRHGLN